MSERAGWTLVTATLLALLAAIIFYATPRKIYRLRAAEVAQQEAEAFRDAVIAKIDLNHLYNQYEANSLPSIHMSTYFDRIESVVKKEMGVVAPSPEMLGRTKAWFIWKIFGGLAVVTTILGLGFMVVDSKLYDAHLKYWRAKTELRKTLTAAQLKTLKEVVRIQHKIAGE